MQVKHRQALERAVQMSGRANVAELIGYSRATVGQVLKGNYRGNMKKVEERIAQKLMGKPVNYIQIQQTLSKIRSACTQCNDADVLLLYVTELEGILLTHQGD